MMTNRSLNRSKTAHRGVQFSAISDILPDFPAARSRHEISPYDRHPNARLTK
jgi:hypothetical protein